MLTYGDGVGERRYPDALLRFHDAHGRLATVTGRAAASSRFGELLARRRSRDAVQREAADRARAGSTAASSCSTRVLDYLDDDAARLEREPLERLAADGQLAVYQHDGFWQCMDTYRDPAAQSLWDSGQAAVEDVVSR